MKKTAKKTTRTMAQAFDEWMRIYTANPEKFMREFEQVAQHKRGKLKGKKCTEYGLWCSRILRRLMRGGTI